VVFALVLLLQSRNHFNGRNLLILV
jgi:hypothetical protein